MSFSSELFHHSFCFCSFSSFFHYIYVLPSFSLHICLQILCFCYFSFLLSVLFFLSVMKTLFELFEIVLPFSAISSRINNNSPKWMNEKDKRHHIFLLFFCFKAEPDVKNYLIKRYSIMNFLQITQTTITANSRLLFNDFEWEKMRKMPIWTVFRGKKKRNY